MDDPGISVSAAGLVRDFHLLGVLEWADVQPAHQVCQLYREPRPEVALALALTVRALRGGSVCLNLAGIADTSFDTDGEPVEVPAGLWPAEADWLAALRGSPAVTVGPEGPSTRPLRLIDTRIYLERYWREEEQVRSLLQQRRAHHLPLPDLAGLAARLEELFGADGDPRQKAAAAHSALSSLTVLAGGPGTGKTTTIARILAVALAGGPCRVALAAPTGKAAARLDEALRASADALPDPLARTIRGLAATTVHRLLGWTPEGRSRFVHHADNPLPHDVVVVDELSMVSLTMMARLLAATPPETRLILVGDPDQLASVEAGAVLGDITGASWTRDDRVGQALQRLVPPPVEGTRAGGAAMADTWAGPVIRLTRNYRFDGVLGELARAIREGDAETAIGLLTGGHPALSLGNGEQDQAALRLRVLGSGLSAHAAARRGDVAEALRSLDDHRLLCAHRHGPQGVATWARRVEHWLREAGDDFGAEGEWYTGRPVLITRNSAEWGLYNGDTGIVVNTGGVPRVYVGDGAAQRALSPYLLDGTQTVYAMTVHRAQGSQFRTVSLVLPRPESPLLTRELLYTAVTRASREVHLIGTEQAVRRAIDQPARRASGLRERL